MITWKQILPDEHNQIEEYLRKMMVEQHYLRPKNKELHGVTLLRDLNIRRLLKL